MFRRRCEHEILATQTYLAVTPDDLRRTFTADTTQPPGPLGHRYTVVLTESADHLRSPDHGDPVAVEECRITFRNDQLVSPANRHDQRCVRRATL